MGGSVSREHAKLPFGYTHARKEDDSYGATASSPLATRRQRLAHRLLLVKNTDSTSITPLRPRHRLHISEDGIIPGSIFQTNEGFRSPVDALSLTLYHSSSEESDSDNAEIVSLSSILNQGPEFKLQWHAVGQDQDQDDLLCFGTGPARGRDSSKESDVMHSRSTTQESIPHSAFHRLHLLDGEITTADPYSREGMGSPCLSSYYCDASLECIGSPCATALTTAIATRSPGHLSITQPNDSPSQRNALSCFTESERQQQGQQSKHDSESPRIHPTQHLQKHSFKSIQDSADSDDETQLQEVDEEDEGSESLRKSDRRKIDIISALSIAGEPEGSPQEVPFSFFGEEPTFYHLPANQHRHQLASRRHTSEEGSYNQDKSHITWMDHDYETVIHLPEDFFGGHQHRYGTDDGNDDDSENDDDELDDDGGDYVEVKRLSSGNGMGTSIADHSTTTLVSAGYSLFNYSMMKGADEDVAHLCPIPFSELPSLSNIGLCSHGIVKLSSNIRLLSSTTRLQLCCNDLCNIPVEIGYLRNLTLLDLSKNSLTTLPDSITQLTKLADLKLSYNFLESIPSTIGKLTKLTSLSLGNNRLTQIPSQIGQLKDLAYFDLSDNPLTVLPAEIARLQYLRRLRLDRCPLLKEFVHVPLHAPPTLLELAARVVVRHGIEVSPIIPTHFKTYLKTAQRCSFCQGPYFETRFKRGKLIEKNNNLIPLEYTLCMPHWNTETQRVRLLFGPRPLTAPPLPPPRPTTAAATPVSTGSRGSTRRHTKSEPASGPAVSASNPTFTSSSQMPIIGHLSEMSTQESGATPVDPNTESLADSGNTGVARGRGSLTGIRSLSSGSKSRGLHGSSVVPASTPASTNSPFTSAPTSSSSASTTTTSGTASPRFSLRLKSRRE